MRASLSTLFASCLLAACSSSSSAPGPTSTTDSGSNATDSNPSADTADDASLPEGSTGDTWLDYAQGFFTKYCTECHDATDPKGLDFTVESIVVANAPTIRCGVAATKQSGCGTTPAPKQFPIADATGTNPKPTDAERSRIVAWIDNGMP